MTGRREVLKALAGVGAVSLGGSLPECLSRAIAAPGAVEAGGGRVLVLVRMAGGNDGLNTVVPFTDPLYSKNRPGVGLGRGSLLKLNKSLGFHPAMGGLKGLFDDGRLSVVQGVGYPNPNRSHFRSMDIWESAQPGAETFSDGWLGRVIGRSQFPDNATPAMALGLDQLPLALRGAGLSVPVIKDPAQLKLRPGPAVEARGRAGRDVVRNLAVQTSGGGPQASFVRNLARSAIDVSRRIGDVLTREGETGLPATGLGRRLEAVVRLIEAGLSSRIYFVSLDGFDTHANQQGAHTALLSELSDAVAAFYRRLSQSKIADRVLLATYSEFGRRVKENGSLGTDHGSASQLFVVTPPGRGGIVGAHPSLEDLDDGDLKHHTDFRRVYAMLLERWLKIPALPAVGKGFKPLEIV